MDNSLENEESSTIRCLRLFGIVAIDNRKIIFNSALKRLNDTCSVKDYRKRINCSDNCIDYFYKIIEVVSFSTTLYSPDRNDLINVRNSNEHFKG